MASKEKKLSAPEDNSIRSEFVRRFKANPFIFIGTLVILVIVIIAFVFVPAIVPGVGGLNADLRFGSYNKTPITYVQNGYFAQVRENIARYRQSSINDSNYQIMLYQIWREAFEETVIHTGMLDEMKQAGYTPPEEVVDREVAQLPQFLDNGRFSVSKYRELDNTTRILLWRQVQESIAKEHYSADMTDLKISSAETAFIGGMASPKRTFDMAVFPLSSYPDTEVTAYAAANAGLFRVTHLSVITVSSGEGEAQKILDSIKDGTTTFEDAARTYSLDAYAERGGDMGVKMVYELSTEIPGTEEREQVIGTARGEYSPIVKVPSGWAFFRVEETPYPADTADSSLLEKIRTYMTNFERGKIEDWFINEARNLITLSGELGFSEALVQKGIEKRNFGPLPLNYGGDTLYYDGSGLFTALASFSVTELSSADTNENFWQEAFFTPLNTPSNPLVLGNNVVVLYPLEETAEDEEAVDSIKTIYSSYWLSYITSNSLRSYFLQSDKLEDRFYEAFTKYILPVE
ncbi:MAG: SurA N-terminal domain-containing protein [Treponema sp.]|jgi:hypothetical protein|nr:SurA N-terminal domain-containing protein [Treponema sp.]